MTTLREAAQQALTILEAWKHKGMWGDWDGVTDALKAALVEDAMQKFTEVSQEIEAALGCDHCNQPLYAAVKCRVCGRVTEPERNFCSRCGKRTNGIHTCTPPAPLTDEVIAELWHQNGGFHHHFARAIERWLRGHA